MQDAISKSDHINLFSFYQADTVHLQIIFIPLPVTINSNIYSLGALKPLFGFSLKSSYMR